MGLEDKFNWCVWDYIYWCLPCWLVFQVATAANLGIPSVHSSKPWYFKCPQQQTLVFQVATAANLGISSGHSSKPWYFKWPQQQTLVFQVSKVANLETRITLNQMNQCQIPIGKPVLNTWCKVQSLWQEKHWLVRKPIMESGKLINPSITPCTLALGQSWHLVTNNQWTK